MCLSSSCSPTSLPTPPFDLSSWRKLLWQREISINQTNHEPGRDRQNLFFLLSPCSHDLFVHWGDSGISCFTRPCCVISLLHPQLLVSLYPHIVKNSMWGTAGLLCIFHMKACTAINKQADRNKSEWQSQAWDRLFPGYSSFFVSGLPCLSCCNVTLAGSLSSSSLQPCCALAHYRCCVSGGACQRHCFV